MNVNITVIGPKGFIADGSRKISTVAEATNAALRFLDGLPRSVDGQQVADWTRITLEIEKG